MTSVTASCSWTSGKSWTQCKISTDVLPGSSIDDSIVVRLRETDRSLVADLEKPHLGDSPPDALIQRIERCRVMVLDQPTGVNGAVGRAVAYAAFGRVFHRYR